MPEDRVIRHAFLGNHVHFHDFKFERKPYGIRSQGISKENKVE